MTTLADLLVDFIEHCAALNYSERTLDEYAAQIEKFVQWLKARFEVSTVDRLTKRHLGIWLRHLHSHRTPRGLPLRIKTARLRVAIVRSFITYLGKQAYVPTDFPNVLESPKDEDVLPSSVLNHEQVKQLLHSVNTTTPLGFRDRAILELFYSSGIRAAELLNLDVDDVDFNAGRAKVMGKGKKERMVPVGKTALRHLQTYVVAHRPFMAMNDPDERALFLSRRGQRLEYSGLLRLVHAYADPLGFGVSVSPHTFRRSCATELIRSGANPYHVKELLGHESLDMLTVYAKTTIVDLKKTHEMTHPRERDEE